MNTCVVYHDNDIPQNGRQFLQVLSVYRKEPIVVEMELSVLLVAKVRSIGRWMRATGRGTVGVLSVAAAMSRAVSRMCMVSRTIDIL
jgi:hypothetical protein